MIVSEVPLLSSKKDGDIPRYAMLENGMFAQVAMTSGVDTDTKWIGGDSLVGSVSISSLGTDSFVATLPTDKILIVTLVQGSTTQVFELDLRNQLEASVIAKVQCFETSVSSLTLMVADAKATIWAINLDKGSFKPTNYRKIVVEQLLDDQDIEYSGAELHTTMVHFISSTTAIIALSPLILTFGMDDQTFFVWSESQVNELMSASIGSILGRASSILLGRTEKVDMAPVAALSYTNNWLFTLHADAKLRQWKLNSSGHPIEVYRIDFQLPDKWATTLAPYSFCITAETYPNSVAAVVHIQTHCNRSTLHLIQSSHDASRQNVTLLHVPEEVSLIVTLALKPGLSPTLFVVATEEGEGTTQFTQFKNLVYTSQRNGLNPTPLVAPIAYTLDGVAGEELQRISAIFDNDWHRVDAFFLRHIFRPAYPRGTGGTMGPSWACVEFAISQHLNSFTYGSSNIELETLKALQQWSRTEQAMSLSKVAPLVESFPDDQTLDDVEAHIRRWKSFATSLWHQEAKRRDPLCIAALPDGTMILIRTDMFSVLREGTRGVNVSKFQSLDDLALSLLSKVETQKPDHLYAIEAGLWEIVTSCSLVLEDHRDNHLTSDIQNLGLWAQSGSFASTQQRLKKMTTVELEEYLETTPREVLFLGLGKDFLPSSLDQGAVPSPEIRNAAAGLVVRGVDAARRLFIGRCLLLLTHFKEESAVHNIVFTKYLHTLAVLWTFSQHVPMPAHPKSSTELFGESPPVRKRLSFGGGHDKSILKGNNRRTSILDAHIVQISSKISPALTLHELITTLAASVLEATFRKPRDSGSICNMLPELGCLPKPYKDDIASDYPRLALRLLATASKYAADMPNAMIARTETLAECLFIEANHSSSQSEHLRRRAFSLLDPAAGHDHYDIHDVSNAFEALIASSKSIPPTMDMMEAEQEMMKEIQHMLYGYVDSAIQQDVRRLSEKESVRMAILPYFCAGGLPNMNPGQKTAIESLLHTLMRLSNSMNRLSIIERRTDRLGRLTRTDNNSINLVFQTTATILMFEEIFLENTYKTMPEYIGLWSLLFRHAEVAGDWTTAVDACIKNPNAECRLKNFEQLVYGMVSAGALGGFLTLCAAGVKDTDLYEIAAGVLTQEKVGEHHNSRGTSPDLLACAYCLHANSGDWKRAAQAMDLRFGDSLRVLSIEAGSSGKSRAARDLTLSAMASFLAIKVVSNPADAFLVAGEFGPYPSIVLVDDELPEAMPKSILKRGRDLQPIASSSTGHQTKDDRLTRFMTANELLARAVRAVAFNTLISHTDATTLPTGALTRPQLAVDINTVNTLASLGFFPLAFSVAEARAVCYADRNGSSMPNGNDLLHVLNTDVVCRYLVPLACDDVGESNAATMEIDHPANKITLLQIQYALNFVSGFTASTAFSYVSAPRYGPRKQQPYEILGASAMELIRQIVLHCDSAAKPMALLVAGSFLEKSDAHLPFWLQNHLTGIGEPAAGLFGKTRKGKSQANPSALCTLFMQHGRYVDACDLVTQVLTGGEIEGNARKAMSSFRVPEKGDIDFVPYNKIDLLWDLVDLSLRRGSIDESTKSMLRISRMKMEDALKLHFTLLKISEEGLRSARALAH